MFVRRGAFFVALGLAGLLLPSPAEAAPALRLVPALRLGASPVSQAPDLPPPPVKIPEASPPPAPPPPDDPTAPVEALPPGSFVPAPPAPPPPAVEEARPSRWAEDVDTTAHEAPPQWDGKVLGMQLLSQLVATAITAVGSFGFGMLYSTLISSGWDALGAVVISGMVLGVILHPLAAHLAGRWMGARGKIWGTLLGFLAGAAGAVLLAALAASTWGIVSTVLTVGALALFYSGSIVGYHLSYPREAAGQAQGRPQGLPLAVVRF
ncbi:MAG: MFS transporter [Deltaproteobacteria bacterium]|nr:MFS transporter [Deltaproteobacteria bacterium]